MKFGGAFGKAGGAVAFGRHGPAAKIARRFAPSIHRTARDLFAIAPPDRPAPERASSLPGPLFAPRQGVIEPQGEVARLTFLGKTEKLSVPNIDFGAPGPAPEYQLWRMNLHYMEYLEEVDDLLWVNLVDAWMDANPQGRRGAWKDSWSSYALAIRVVVWMQELARRAPRLPGSFVRRAEASLACQLRFLEHNLETDLGGNHLIKNVKALIWGASYFTGDEAARGRATGAELLQVQLPEQILADGMHYEGSPSYPCQVFADLLEIHHALGGAPFGA